MKVTFDSNVWRWVVAPEDTPKDRHNVYKELPNFRELNRLCSQGLIEGYLSCSMFAWEAVRRMERKDALSNDKGEIIRSELIQVGDGLDQTISFGPDRTAHPGTPEEFIYYLEKARHLGFKVMRIPRIGYLFNRDLLETDYVAYDEAIPKRFGDVVQIIESRGGGMAQLLSFGRNYATNLQNAMELTPDSKIQKVADAVAEWADGDSVAIHLAHGNHFFCTLDNAKKAGQKSVMHSSNVEYLTQMVNLKKVSPDELVRLI
jgi:hypothetical protein